MICTYFERLVSSHENSVCSLITIFQNLYFTNSSLFPFVFLTAGFESVQLRTSAYREKENYGKISEYVCRSTIYESSWQSGTKICDSQRLTVSRAILRFLPVLWNWHLSWEGWRSVQNERQDLRELRQMSFKQLH